MTSASGDGATLVYAVLLWDVVGDFSECHRRGCSYRVTRGGIWRVVGSKRISIPGVSPAFLVAASAGRVLVVPADRSTCVRCVLTVPAVATCAKCGPRAQPNGAVDIRDATSGKLLRRLSPRGEVLSADLSEPVAAVLVRKGTARRIELYDHATGEIVRTVAVPSSTAEVAVSNDLVAYITSRSVFLVSADSVRMLAKSSGRPVSLSFDDDRVVWIDDGKKVDRLLELTVSS